MLIRLNYTNSFEFSTFRFRCNCLREASVSVRTKCAGEATPASLSVRKLNYRYLLPQWSPLVNLDKLKISTKKKYWCFGVTVWYLGQKKKKMLCRCRNILRKSDNEEELHKMSAKVKISVSLKMSLLKHGLQRSGSTLTLQAALAQLYFPLFVCFAFGNFKRILFHHAD